MSDRKLLIVDDDAQIRSTLNLILSTSGFEVRTAGDGFEALSCLREVTPDVLLSDLYMPGMSGFELLCIVRRRFPDVKVIAMSGAYSGSSVPEGIAADAFYPKGTGIKDLFALLETLTDIDRSTCPTWLSVEPYKPDLLLSCPDCLRVFIEPSPERCMVLNEVACVYCKSSFQFALLDNLGTSSTQGCGVPGAKTFADAH